MTREKAPRVLIAVAVCAALLGALVVLTANLDRIALDPGRTPATADEPADEAAAGEGHDGPTWDFGFVRHILLVAFTASLAIVLVGALLTRFLRKWLYFTIGLFGALIVFDFFADKVPSAGTLEEVDPSQEQVVAAPAEPGSSDWTHVLVAVGLALGAGAALVLSSSWIVTRWRAHASRRGDGQLAWELELLAEQALGPGRNSNAVLRCYHEMVDLLSRREQIPHASLTPREFADRLRDLELRSEAIDRLTRLFELVRYGHRDSEPLANGATASLEEVREDALPAEDRDVRPIP